MKLSANNHFFIPLFIITTLAGHALIEAKIDTETIKTCEGVWTKSLSGQFNLNTQAANQPLISLKWSEGKIALTWDSVQKFFNRNGQFIMGAATAITVLLALKLYCSYINRISQEDQAFFNHLNVLSNKINTRYITPDAKVDSQFREKYSGLPSLSTLLDKLDNALSSNNAQEFASLVHATKIRVGVIRMHGYLLACMFYYTGLL